MQSVICPQCQTALRITESLAGQRVRCPRCRQIFLAPNESGAAQASAAAPTEPPSAPPLSRASRPVRRHWDEETSAPAEDYDDDLDYSRRHPGFPQDTSAPLGFGVAALTLGILGLFFAFIPFCGALVAVPTSILGIILGIVALVLAVTRKRYLALGISSLVINVLAPLIALAWWIFLGNVLQEAQQQVAPPLPQIPAGPPQPPPLVQLQPRPFQPPLPNARLILQRHEHLTLFDPPSPLGRPGKTIPVTLTAGKKYQIDLESIQFDAYLILENPERLRVAEDDDSGGNLNARIIYLCPRTGEYRIICTSFNGRVGDFTLTVKMSE